MIEITNSQRKHRIRTETFRRLLEGLAEHYRLRDPEVTLAFVGDRAIRTLNRRYLKKDRPTDVLSFPLGDKAADGRHYLGDIAISVPAAARQGRAKGHSLERELKILAIHGFLHLLGHHHAGGIGKEEQTIRMKFLP